MVMIFMRIYIIYSNEVMFILRLSGFMGNVVASFES